MDNLNETIQNFLSQPDAMAQIQTMASALGLDTSKPQTASAPSEPAEESPPPRADQLSKLLSVLQSASGTDKAADILLNLKPGLSEQHQPKIDRAFRAIRYANAVRALAGSLEL